MSVTAWSPLRHPTFRSLWLAQLAHNIGGFMQMVGAVWLVGTLGGGPTLVALVQTATSLPTLALSLPAGVLADLVDRRRLIIGMQLFMCAVALLLALLTGLGAMTPVLVLVFTFALACGHAVHVPAWSAIQPDLVPRAQFAQAVTLASASQNLGRVVGPALGGIVLALAGTETVFVINALTFIGVTVALLRWRADAGRRKTSGEPFRAALRSGARYTRYSASFRGVLIRIAALSAPASATMALLPVVARDDLALDARGYGVLLGCYGLGAVLASTVIPALRARLGPDRTVLVGVAALVVNLGALAAIRSPVVLGATLIIGGAGWLMTLSTLNVAAQSALPDWVRARGLGFFFLAFQGAFAIGSAVFGAIAGRATVELAFVIAAVTLLGGTLVTRRFTLTRIDALELAPAAADPDVTAWAAPPPEPGPMVVTIEYRVDAARREAFVDAVRRAGRMRRRVGYTEWSLAHDPADPSRFVETFRAESWDDHARARSRMTVTDERMERALDEFAVPGGGTVQYTNGYDGTPRRMLRS